MVSDIAQNAHWGKIIIQRICQEGGKKFKVQS